MSDYCVGLLFSPDLQHVVLTAKNRSSRRVGRLHGVEGKVELGETINAAMARIFSEETGVHVAEWTLFHTESYVFRPDADIDTVRFLTAVHPQTRLYKLTDDHPNWWHLDCWSPQPHVYNLDYLIPMALSWHCNPEHHYVEVAPFVSQAPQ